MIRTALILAVLAAPTTAAAAATVTFDDGSHSKSWGKSLSLTGKGGYRVTAEDRDRPLADGRTLIGSWSFFNDTILGTGSSRTHTGSVDDGAIGFAFSMTIDTTRNAPGLFGNVSDVWSLSMDLPPDYLLDFGVRTHGTGLVSEGRTDRAYLYRLADHVDLPPAPVPLPAAGLLLLAGIGVLGLRGRK